MTADYQQQSVWRGHLLTEHLDESTGYYYYKNHTTQETYWDKPAGVDIPLADSVTCESERYVVAARDHQPQSASACTLCSSAELETAQPFLCMCAAMQRRRGRELQLSAQEQQRSLRPSLRLTGKRSRREKQLQ